MELVPDIWQIATETTFIVEIHMKTPT